MCFMVECKKDAGINEVEKTFFSFIIIMNNNKTKNLWAHLVDGQAV